jgi:hypothetical protein
MSSEVFILTGMPFHFGRADQSPAGPDRAAETAPVPGLADYAARAGWQGRIRALMQQLPPDQRSQLMSRLRTEGPNVVFRELLNGGAGAG